MASDEGSMGMDSLPPKALVGGPSVTRRIPRRWVAVTTGVVLLGVATVGTLTAADPDQVAIRTVVRQALEVTHNGIVRPAGHGPLSGQVVQQMRNEVSSELSKYYTGAQLSEHLSTMQRNVDAQADGAVEDLGGGVNTIRYDDVQVTGDRATVKATANVWSRIALAQTDPSPTMQVVSRDSDPDR